MNKKALNSILVILVLGVWMTVFYRVWSSYSNAATVVDQDQSIHNAMPLTIKRDTFSLLQEYRDPFLGEAPAKKKIHNPVPNQAATKKTSVLKKEPAPWPVIKFLGIVKNINSNQSMALLNIDGRGIRMRAGETHNEIRLEKIYKDSILVYKSKESKMIRK